MRISPLLAQARKTGNPVLDGDSATFVWHGATPPFLIDDLHNWDESPQKMKPAGTNLWSFSLELPADAYLEYAFLNERSCERMTDPLNPRRIWNGVNNYNHFFYMPEGKSTPLIQAGRSLPRGSVTRYDVQTHELAVGSTRPVYLYRPPVEGPVPLVVVYDGPDYLRRGKLNIIVDNLIASGKVKPFAMAMVQNGGPARSIEYSCSESTLGFLMESVVPLAREHLGLTPPEETPYGVIGASLGGLMALYTGLRLPRIFGKVLSQSGAFGLPEYHFAIVDLIRYAPRPDLHIWMDAGSFEWLLDGNREMHKLLKKKEYPVKYREFSGGHNYTSWRNDLPHGLKKLFDKEE